MDLEDVEPHLVEKLCVVLRESSRDKEDDALECWVCCLGLQILQQHRCFLAKRADGELLRDMLVRVFFLAHRIDVNKILGPHGLVRELLDVPWHCGREQQGLAVRRCWKHIHNTPDIRHESHLEQLARWRVCVSVSVGRKCVNGSG